MKEVKYEVSFDGHFYVTVPFNEDVFKEKEAAKTEANMILYNLLEKHGIYSFIKNVGYYCKAGDDE